MKAHLTIITMNTYDLIHDATALNLPNIPKLKANIRATIYGAIIIKEPIFRLVLCILFYISRMFVHTSDHIISFLAFFRSFMMSANACKNHDSRYSRLPNIPLLCKHRLFERFQVFCRPGVKAAG